MEQQNGQRGMAEKWAEINKMEEEISTKMDEMKEMATKKRKMMDEIMKEMAEKDAENVKLKKENRALKMKMAKMEADLKAQNISICRKLPVELMTELFGSLSLEKAFGLLAKMPNGLLARNVQKMVNSIKMAIKNNKFNSADSVPNWQISEDGLVLKHSGPEIRNTVRALLPIPPFNSIFNKPTISFYFEVEILNKSHWNCSIYFGFCTPEFPLENIYLGDENTNSIGIGYKQAVDIDGTEIEFVNSLNETEEEFENNDQEFFKKGDFVGIGLAYYPANSKLECFATWNGELLGKAELPSKFANVQLFPALSTYHDGDEIRVNYGKEEWKFKEFERIFKY